MELPERILDYLSTAKQPVESEQLAKEFDEDHQKVVGAIKSLESLGNLIQTEIKTIKQWNLSAEGEEVVKRGSHEAVLFSAVPQDGSGISKQDLMNNVGAAIGKIGFSKALQQGWILIDKADGGLVKRKLESITDIVKNDLSALSQADKQDTVPEKLLAEYKKRKLVEEKTVKRYVLTKGEKFTTKIEKAATDLTAEMIASGEWKTANFKPYNFEALGIQPPAGHLHPLLKVRAEYRQIFLEMGFSEMPTNNFVESSFWNFDALFQPQQHPARDAHDTFFISDPAEAMNFPMDYLEKVKKVHSKGGFGSQGYGYDWKIEEAKKNLLRTHTTAVSARMLYKLAQEYQSTGIFEPKKYFSIDRVFRNETLDATHLAEFHQIEGVVADKGLTLGDLLGIINAFFEKLGIKKIRFKPAYNPYTEPSMEIFSYHEGLKKWVEIGNSGVFRPEMLLPMGLPNDVSVIAWGLSLERPTMIKYGINNIRDLVGHKIDLKMVQENPLCRLDKDNRRPLSAFFNITENRWNEIESKLGSLVSRVSRLRQQVGLTPVKKDAFTSLGEKDQILKDLVIHSNPEFPPYSVQFFLIALSQMFPIHTSVHVHSSLTKEVSYELKDFLDLKDVNNQANCNARSNCKYGITIIWKDIGKDPLLVINPGSHVKGEVNIIRYLSRLVDSLTNNLSSVKHLINYDMLSPAKVAQMDEHLDSIHQFIHNECPKERKVLLADLLNCKNNISDASSICDIAMLSICKQEQARNANILSKNDKQSVNNIRNRCIANNPFVKTTELIL